QAGDKIAFCLENCAEVFEFCWGAQRSGLAFVPISSRLTADEISYILQDSGAKLLLSSDYKETELAAVETDNPDVHFYKTGTFRAGWTDWCDALDAQATTPISDEERGLVMFYSSGTTGNPKGIAPPPPAGDPPETEEILQKLVQHFFGGNEESIYLCPAPLYHAAPLAWTMSLQRLGAKTVIMEKFDPEAALKLIEKHKINIAQFVPTHFVRMLKLPDEVRAAADTSSLRSVVHAAAPCPVPVKEAMIEWWGPVIDEYYAGSEGNGMTFIRSEEWLAHKGSVGKAILGTLRICDENGDPVPTREEGQIFFEGGPPFQYHKAEAKTAESQNKHGWTSLGDIGWLDEEGYLYLTDRKSFMIISGGVNIYPQEIENHLITHPKVMDVAVIGGPCPDMGERVIAIVQPTDMADATDAFGQELEAFAREKLSGVKIPRQIDFREELPRALTGKLYKRLLRDEYWKQAEAQ
ncbi:MAG: acyl-CoA synthetase, partial [Pseudomonadota bacterium]